MSLQLEVGKTYITRIGDLKRLIVAKDGEFFIGRDSEGNSYIQYTLNGLRTNGPHRFDLVKEYKEPRVTEMDVVLVKPGPENADWPPEYRTCTITPKGKRYDGGGYWTEVSRQTVTFTEEE